MNNSACLWEKNNDYYVTNSKACDDCGEPFKEFVVVTWLDNEIKFLHLHCQKKYKQFRHIKANIVASVVKERPKGAVYVGKPFDYLTSSNSINNDIMQEGVKVVDKTIHAYRETLQGFSVGVIPEKKIEQLDSEVKDINVFLSGIKESVPVIEESKTKQITKKEVEKNGD